jgi:flagellar motor switch protein FliN/FliY
MKNDLPTSSSGAATLHPVELAPLQAAGGAALGQGALGLAALAGVQARVTIVAGQVNTTVGELLALREGTVMKLDAELNRPFDLMLNDTVIARGELVAVDDHFGVRITQVASAK